MTRLQRIQLRQSEVRSKIAEVLDTDEADREDGALERLTKELAAGEVELRAALAIEDEENGEDEVLTSPTPEEREMESLRNKVEFRSYLDAAMNGRGVIVGAEAEYNKEVGLKENQFPLDLLSGLQVETRAKLDGDGQTNQVSWIDRLFAESAAMRLGVTTLSVDPGVSSVPITTGGGQGRQRGRTQDAPTDTFAFSLVEMKPTRNAIHLEYSVEDSARVPGLSDAIERDMNAAIMDAIDRAIFIGDAGADEASADITGLTTAGIGEVEITQANKVLGPGTLEAFLGMVDGIYAGTLAELNVVPTVGAYRLWEGTIVNAAAENQTLAAFLRTAGLTFTSRGDIETATAAGDFGAFVGLSRGIAGTSVAAVWNAGEMIRDPYSKAKSGEVLLTVNYLWDFKIPRTANYKRVKFVA